MTLLERVEHDMAAAMRARDQTRLAPLRMLKASLVNRRVEKGRELDEAEALQIVSTLVKQRRESIEQFTSAGRPELADKEQAEIRVLEAYLPPPASPEDVARAVDEAIAETGAASPRDLGRVMKSAMGKLAGRSVDGKAVNELARRRLAGS